MSTKTNVMRTVIAGVAIMLSGACATKGFVRTNVTDVNDKVNALASSLEQTEQRVAANRERIGHVDGQTVKALQTANRADAAAAKAAELATSVDGAITALDKARHKLLFDVVMSGEEDGFGFDSAALPDAVKSDIDALIAKLKAAPADVFITIEGHTDSVGPSEANERLGLERARAVERYLYEAHQIPLHKMDVISHGETEPVAPNTTRTGRAQNRRVEIKIVS